jgi:hypothetical protein
MAAAAGYEFGLGLRLLVGRHSEAIDSNADAKTTKIYAHYGPDATNEAAFVTAFAT